MGSRSFLPGGLLQTAAQATAAGRGMRSRRSSPRRRKKSSASRAGGSKRRKARGSARTAGRKPRPGTKAWMAYIRGMRRGKKRK